MEIVKMTGAVTAIAFLFTGFAMAIDLVPVWTKAIDPKKENGTSEFCEFSPDGKLILCGDSQGKAWVIRASDGSVVTTFTFITAFTGLKGGEVECGAFSPDMKQVAMGGNGKPIKIFEYSSGKVLKEISSSETDGMAFSPDGKYLATAVGKNATMLESGTWNKFSAFDMGCGVNTFDFLKDGSHMIAGSCAKNVIIVAVSGRNIVRTIKTPGSVKSARISPNGAMIATGNADANSANVYDYKTGSRIKELPHRSTILEASPGDDPNNVNDPHYVEAVAWSTDGSYLFTAGPVDGQINIFQTSNWQKVKTVKGSQGAHPIEYLDVSPDGRYLASSGEDGYLHLWRIDGVSTQLKSLDLAQEEGNGLLRDAIRFDLCGRVLGTNARNYRLQVMNSAATFLKN